MLVVIFGHAAYPSHYIPADLGVSAFFVLSGFLITRLLLRELDRTGKISVRDFYARRTLRIFPAYYAFITLSFVLDARHGQHWTTSFLVSALTYTVNYFNAFHHHPSTSIAHAWSLAIEEQFYLLWPLIVVLLATRGRRSLARGATILAAAVLCWRSWLVFKHTDVAYLYNAFDTRFDNLAIGCLLAVLVENEWTIQKARSVARHSFFPLLTLGILLVSRLALPEAYQYSIGLTVDALLVAILITQLLQLYETPLWSWLERPSVRYLGAISYPMYLYHQWGQSLGHRAHFLSTGGQFAVGLVSTVVLATGSYNLIEKPFLLLKKRFTARTRKPVMTTYHLPAPVSQRGPDVRAEMTRQVSDLPAR